MRLRTNPAAMGGFAETMLKKTPYEILQQDDTAHIVLSKPDESVGYVVLKAGAVLKGTLITSVSAPCILFTRCMGAGLTSSIKLVPN